MVESYITKIQINDYYFEVINVSISVTLEQCGAVLHR